MSFVTRSRGACNFRCELLGTQKISWGGEEYQERCTNNSGEVYVLTMYANYCKLHLNHPHEWSLSNLALVQKTLHGMLVDIVSLY